MMATVLLQPAVAHQYWPAAGDSSSASPDPAGTGDEETPRASCPDAEGDSLRSNEIQHKGNVPCESSTVPKEGCANERHVSNAQCASSQATENAMGSVHPMPRTNGLASNTDFPENGIDTEADRDGVDNVQSPGNSSNVGGNRTASGHESGTANRHALRSMLCDAFRFSVGDEVGVREGSRGSLSAKPSSLGLRKSRQSSTSSLLSTSSGFSGSATRSGRRGSTGEADRAVKAILRRVQKQEQGEKARDAGDAAVEGVINSFDVDEDFAEDILNEDNSDSDCDVSCDRHIQREKDQLAQRRKDIDSALTWLKFELVR